MGSVVLAHKRINYHRPIDSQAYFLIHVTIDVRCVVSFLMYPISEKNDIKVTQTLLFSIT